MNWEQRFGIKWYYCTRGTSDRLTGAGRNMGSIKETYMMIMITANVGFNVEAESSFFICKGCMWWRFCKRRLLLEFETDMQSGMLMSVWDAALLFQVLELRR